jgi:hypothetical protein
MSIVRIRTGTEVTGKRAAPFLSSQLRLARRKLRQGNPNMANVKAITELLIESKLERNQNNHAPEGTELLNQIPSCSCNS